MIALMLLAQAADPCGAKDNQAEMTMCEGAAAERADAEMNLVWKQIHAAMVKSDKTDDRPSIDRRDPGYTAALLSSQRAWLAFREAECRIESYEWRGGSMQPFRENQCRLDVTRARTRQLKLLQGWDK